MDVAPPYCFRPVTLDDAGLIAGWQAQPHVSAWWDADGAYSDEDLRDPHVARWIVSIGGQPFGFIQDYTVHGWEDHHFAHIPQGARGIDQFIGDPEMIGIGHGTALIGARVAALLAAGAPVVATDPHPDNARAIAVYRKLGFEVSGPVQNTQWGVILPMVRAREV